MPHCTRKGGGGEDLFNFFIIMKHRNQTNGGMRLQKKKVHEDLTAAQQEIEA